MTSEKLLNSLGQTAKICRKALIAVNSCAATVAVLLVAGGLLLRFGQGFLGPHIADLVQSLSDVASGAGIDVMDLSQFDFGKILAGMALTIVLLAVGTGLLSGVGMFGAKQNLFVFTIMYCVLLTLWIIAEIVGAIIIFAKRDLIDKTVIPSLVSALKQEYKGFNGTDAVSQTWNLIMVVFSCCGVNNYTDFLGSKKWNRDYYQEGWFFTLATPLPCCVFSGKAADDYSCAVNPQQNTSNYLKGCYLELWRILDNYKSIVIIIISVILLLQVMLLACSGFLTRALRIASRKSRKDDGKKDKKKESKKTKRKKQKDTTDPIQTGNTESNTEMRYHDSNIRTRSQRPGLFQAPFPGLPNHPYSPSMLNMMQNRGSNYLAQLVAAAFLQQHAPGFVEDPFNNFTQDQYTRQRHSEPAVVVRNIRDLRRRRSSQELAVSLYTYPPSYDAAVSPRILTIDEVTPQGAGSPSWPRDSSCHRSPCNDWHGVSVRDYPVRTVAIDDFRKRAESCPASDRTLPSIPRNRAEITRQNSGYFSRSPVVESDRTACMIVEEPAAIIHEDPPCTSPAKIVDECQREVQGQTVERHTNCPKGHDSPKTEGRRDCCRQRTFMGEIFKNSKFSQSFSGFPNSKTT